MFSTSTHTYISITILTFLWRFAIDFFPAPIANDHIPTCESGSLKTLYAPGMQHPTGEHGSISVLQVRVSPGQRQSVQDAHPLPATLFHDGGDAPLDNYHQSVSVSGKKQANDAVPVSNEKQDNEEVPV